ncbi:unnamed protein product, partial [Phaeothamnion confervicola]
NGAGQCGTCTVALDTTNGGWSPRSAVEEAKLKGRPAAQRLACQTLVGGDAVVTVRPSKR